MKTGQLWLKLLQLQTKRGGVGKTTTAINLSAALAHLGQDTLLIDLDPQGNATSGLGFRKAEIQDGIYQNLVDGKPLKKTIKATGVELLDIVCSTPDMIGAELELADIVSRENKLREALAPFKDAYSFMIIDCPPPSLGLLTINALACSTGVLIPIQGEYYSLEGLAQFQSAILRLKSSLNPGLKIEGGVLTMFDPRYTLSQQVLGELKRFFGESLYNTHIPRSVRLAEAPSFGQTIFQYEPRSRGSQTYLALAGELLSRRGWTGMKLSHLNGRK